MRKFLNSVADLTGSVRTVVSHLFSKEYDIAHIYHGKKDDRNGSKVVDTSSLLE